MAAEHDAIIALLQENMNEEFRATLQYICHRISAKERDQVLADSFKTAALDEMAHILFFSDLITRLGGSPRFTAWEIDTSTDLAAMLEADIALEEAAVQRYRHQLPQLEPLPEVRDLVADVLDDESDHQELFRHYREQLG